MGTSPAFNLNVFAHRLVPFEGSVAKPDPQDGEQELYDPVNRLSKR